MPTKQRNCHARSKQKRKQLRLKNRVTATHERRLRRYLPEPPKGITIYGEAKKAAVHMSDLYPTGSSWYWNTGNTRDKSLNQRQKRKRARWVGRKVA